MNIIPSRPCSESFLMQYGISIFFELLLRHPHLFEGRQRCQDGSAYPCGKLSLWGSRDANLDVLWSKFLHFVQKPVAELLEHGGSTGQNDLREEGHPEVQVCSVDGRGEQLMDAWIFQANQAWVEENLRCSEPLCAQADDRTIWQLVLVLHGRLVILTLLFLLRIHGDIALLLFYLPHHLPFSRGVKDMTRAPQL